MMRVAAAALLLAMVSGANRRAATIRVTDTKGVATELSAVAVDYGTMWSRDVDSTGIRVMRGDGEVLLKWASFDTLRVVARVDSNAMHPLTLEAVLRSGRRMSVTLQRKGRMKLTGTTELGAYSVDLDSVRVLSPLR